MDKIYSESFYLSAGECNAEQEMSLPLLVAKLIDIATAHANLLHIGNPDMPDVRGGWVLSRLTVEMKSYPKVNDHYTIRTWVESWNRHFSSRCFSIEEPDGTVRGYVRSIWMIMDMERHTNVALDRFTFGPDLIEARECPIPMQAKHLQIVAPEEFTGARGTIAATHPDAYYRFAYCDLDFYRHVNTVRYVTLLLNQFTLSDYEKSFVGRLEMSFLREAKYDMKVAIHRSDEASKAEAEAGAKAGAVTSSFYLTDSEDAQPVLYSRLRLTPRD